MLEIKTTTGEVLGVQEGKKEDLSEKHRDAKPAYAKGRQTESCIAAENQESDGMIGPPPPDVEELYLIYVPKRFRKKFRQSC